MRSSDPTPGWFRQHFNEDYRAIYQGRDQAQADEEVELVSQELKIGRGDTILDLCCGYGRHLNAFAKHGLRATGVDLSLPLLRQVEPPCARRVVCADMRALPFVGGQSGFSVIVNFFTSFGYFQAEAEHSYAARELARVLRPGGRFCMDLMNATATIRSLQPHTKRVAGPYEVTEERTYDDERRRIEKRITLLEKDSKEAKYYVESVRVFSPMEITDLLTHAGLEVDRMLGGFSGTPYQKNSERMIVLGRRPQTSLGRPASTSTLRRCP